MPNVIPIAQDELAGVPSQESNQRDRLGQADQKDLAKESRDFHWRGLRARRLRDLTSEKYLLHVDGEGLSQWLDIFRGTRLRSAPDLLGVPRAQNNQMRPILDNFVAHLTTQNYQFVVEAKPDRQSRESAVIDQAVINADVRRQNWNALWAEAKYMAACAGFCPVHAMWRDEQGDPYEAVLAEQPNPQGEQQPMQGPVAGSIDSFVGNPFDTVFNSGARRNSVHRATYGRVLPAELVRQAFGRDDIEGNDRLPSASTYQRVVQRWIMAGGFTHGTAALSLGWGHEEMVGLIYDETLPGVDPEWPEGRLVISALKGLAATQRIEARGGLGEPTFLWGGPLPARVFSFVLTYSHHRFDDVHGKPYMGDIDDDQIELNQLESLYNEFVRRATRAPLASSGKISVETAGPLGDTLLEVEPLLHGGNIEMQFLEQPARHMPFLESKIARVQDGMYRKAGWQAASRGENVGGSGKAIIALQQADDSIFGPITQRTREELESYADLCWRIRKEFMDVPMILDVVGDDLAHLARPHVDRTMMSEGPPVFTLVSGFGTSTEAKAQQLLNMFGMVDARGEQLIGTREIRRLWPDNSLFPQLDDPQEAKERRPRIVNELIRQQATQFVQEQQMQFSEWQPSMQDPMTAQAGEYVAFMIDAMEPALPDDDLESNIETLSLITQDPTENPLARRTAMVRQGQYWEWLAAQQAAVQGQQAGGGGGRGRPVGRSGGGQGAASAFQPGKEGGTPTAESMAQADKRFEREIA